jgi:hypothetical protein
MGLPSAQPPAPSTAVASRQTEIKSGGLVHCRSYKYYHAYQQRTTTDFGQTSSRRQIDFEKASAICPANDFSWTQR